MLFFYAIVRCVSVSFGISAIAGTMGAGWLIRVGEVQLMYRVSALLTFCGIILALRFQKNSEQNF